MRPVTLSKKTVTGLFFIQRYRFLAIAQFAKVSELKGSSSSEVLRNFEARGFLGHFGNVGLRGHGKTPKVYYLKRKGHELLKRESDIPEEMIGPFKETFVEAKWSPQMYHRLRLVDLLISLEIGVRNHPQLSLVQTFLEYRRVKENGRVRRETTDFVAKEKIPENRIIPDAGFVIENIESGKRALFFIEMDMATERIVSTITKDKRITLHYKMEQYDRYLRSGLFAQTYEEFGDFKYFTLLFVTTLKNRVDNIRKEMLDLPSKFHKYYRFNSFDVVEADFFNNQWKTRSIEDDRGYKIMG